MFNVDYTPEFTHDVPINVPADDGHEVQTLRTRFRYVPEDKGEIGAAGLPADLGAYLKARIVRFEDLAGKDDKPLDYTEALRDGLLKIPYIRVGLYNGYVFAMAGARQGN